jgi:hypothetical protein
MSRIDVRLSLALALTTGALAAVPAGALAAGPEIASAPGRVLINTDGTAVSPSPCPTVAS